MYYFGFFLLSACHCCTDWHGAHTLQLSVLPSSDDTTKSQVCPSSLQPFNKKVMLGPADRGAQGSLL